MLGSLQGTSAFDTTIQVSGIFVKVRQVNGVYQLLEAAAPNLHDIAPTLFLYSQSVIDAIVARRRGLRIVAIVDDSNELHPSTRALSELGAIQEMTLLGN